MIQLSASRLDSTKAIFRATATEQTLDAKLKSMRRWAIENQAPIAVTIVHDDGMVQSMRFGAREDSR